MEKEHDSFGENDGNSETEMSPAVWLAVVLLGRSEGSLAWPDPRELIQDTRLLVRVTLSSSSAPNPRSTGKSSPTPGRCEDVPT